MVVAVVPVGSDCQWAGVTERTQTSGRLTFIMVRKGYQKTTKLSQHPTAKAANASDSDKPYSADV